MAKLKVDRNRRDLLKALAVLPANFPLSGLANLLVNGFIENAKAAETNAKVRNYIFLMSADAPPRWVFDLLLTPYSTAGFVANAQVGTVGVAVDGRYTSVKYQTVERKVAGVTLNLPPLWAAKVPSASGGTRTLDSILQNAIHIRGIETAAPAHSAAVIRCFRPIGATYTVTGLIADTAEGLPLKGINVGIGYYEFEGKTGATHTTFARDKGKGLGSALLNPFSSGAPAAFQENLDALSSEIDQAQNALDAFALSQHPGSESVRKSQADVETMMKSAVSGLSTKWNTLFDKYERLIARSLREISVPGVHDKPMGAKTRPAESPMYRFRDGDYVRSPIDLNEIIDPNDTRIVNMAEAFALSELVISEKLSNSVSALVGSFGRMKVNNASVGWTHDEHHVGALVSLTTMTKWYGAFGACLAELIDRLKALKVFDETVIQTGAEFNRSPRSDGTGSDHGHQANSTMLFNGMVKAPIIIGNVLNNSGISRSPGSWGVATESVNGKKITPAHVANAVAALLNLPEIVRSGEENALLKVNLATKTVTSRVAKASQK